MVFPGSEASLFADMNLIAQTAGILILFSGSLYARRKNFFKHDKMAKIAVSLASLSLIWMGFSLVSNFLLHVSLTLSGLLIVSHSVIGMLALFLGVFMVLDEIKKTKTLMRVVFFSWNLALLLGVIMYIVFLWPDRAIVLS